MKINKFYELEKTYNLLDFEIENVKIWNYLRAEIFHMIYSTQPSNISLKHKKFPWKEFLYNLVFFNPFFSKENEKLVFLNPRKKYFNGKIVDPILYDFYYDKNVNVIDCGNNKVSYPKCDFINFYMAINRKIKSFNFKIPIKKIKEIKNIEKIIYDNFNIKIDLESIFYKYVLTFKSFYEVYIKLFNKLKPKEIYFLVNYGQAPLIKAAKDLGIKTIEVQHGIFGYFHPGYCYPYKKDIEYFPDELYVWGEYFKNLSYLPKCNKKIVRLSFLEKQFLSVKNISKLKRITVIGTSGDDKGAIETFLLKNKNLFKNYEIIYKFHPSEYDNPILFHKNELIKNFNIKFYKDEEPLYSLLKSSEYIISPRSTVVYEALELESKVILVKTIGWEDMLDIKDYLYFVDKDEIIDLQNIKSNSPFKKGYFIESAKVLE